MRRLRRRNMALNVVLLLYLLGCLGPSPVSSISVSSPPEVHASKGDTVSLSCTFTSTSRPTSKMSFFHFSSRAFPPLQGQFAGRIRWQGIPARGDASISLINATLNDNGTFTCSVRNPPDVHGYKNQTGKSPSIRFSDVAVLFAFILIPSTVITLILIGRMFCPKKQQNQSRSYRSPIEVTEGEEYGVHPPEAKVKRATCCDLYLTEGEARPSSKWPGPKTSSTHGVGSSVTSVCGSHLEEEEEEEEEDDDDEEEEEEEGDSVKGRGEERGMER
ncbi:hypothetical protein INR49_015852, partial [Caranx melampygus]